jgi:hypothetical protein
VFMISTVTTSTVSTITTSAIAGSVALVAIMVLLFLLIQKELASSASGARLKTLTRVLNIGIVPLLLAFVVVVVTRVAEILK